MNLKKSLFIVALSAGLVLAGCDTDDVTPETTVSPVTQPPGEQETPDDLEDEGPVVTLGGKPKAMWIDVHANFELLSKKANIDAELEKIKKYGMNMIYVDVKSSNGYALYKSDFLPYCNSFANLTVTRDYDDYLGYILEKCNELGIDVVASVVATGWGYNAGGLKQGYIYDHWDEWGDKVQVRSDNDNPSITVPISEDPLQPLVVLDPMYPEVQDLIVKTCREIVERYPGLKGISLDYLRYNNNDNGWYGMGADNMKGYAEYWNEPAPSHLDVVTATGGMGPCFAKWIEYRSALITDVLAKIRKEVKAVRPECEIHLWASGDWGSRYSVGQNWASKNYKPFGIQYTDTYSRTGFAELLDVFVTGAYSEKVWNYELPGSIWTVENFCTTWNDYIMDACKCYGSIAAYALTPSQIADATYLCLTQTDGYMTFELSHVNNTVTGDRWQGTLDGIKLADK